MIIRVLMASRGIELREVLKDSTPSADGEHAWVSQRALREWSGVAEETWWQEGLSKMIAAAQRFPWVD